jgi:nicotinamidase-related amidase
MSAAVLQPLKIRKAKRALLILDMITDFDFPDGKAAVRAARRIAPQIARFKARAVAARIPVIYVNDNLGPWRSDIQAMLARCLRRSAPGRDVVRQIAPADDDFVLLKPKHSGFYATPLAALLEQCGARELILTGLSAHQCVLFTANDAYLRNFELIIPSDCIASPKSSQTQFALRYFKSVLNARTTVSARLKLHPSARGA